MRKIFVTTLFATVITLAEPSVYIHSPNGLSSGDSSTIYAIQQKLAQQKEEIEGLKSIVESLSQQLNSQRQSGGGGGDNNYLISKIRSLEARVDKLERLLASKSSYTNKSSTRAKQTPKSRTSKTTTSNKDASYISSLEQAPSNKLFSRGVRLINQKRYKEAKQRFDILLKRRYKLASSNFYEGEIAYKTGKYSDAIKYYQRSAELNENAAYMDRLLLHTAIALHRIGEKEQAKNFFQAIIDGYPGTYSARVAKRYLK